jgi:NADH-quinone oxidoreductase subunit H
LARGNRVPAEKYVLLGLAIILLLLAGLVAYPPVLHAIQGVFWFTAKVMAFLYAFIWYRGTFPRYRYDQLMHVGWRWMIPLALANIIITATLRYLVSGQAAPAPAAWLGG